MFIIRESWKEVETKFGNRSPYTADELSMAEDAAKRAYKLARSELWNRRIMVPDSQADHDHHIINGALSLLLLGYDTDFKLLCDEIFDQGRSEVRYKCVGMALDMARRVLGQASAAKAQHG